jgi:hypothetical protein
MRNKSNKKTNNVSTPPPRAPAPSPAPPIPMNTIYNKSLSSAITDGLVSGVSVGVGSSIGRHFVDRIFTNLDTNKNETNETYSKKPKMDVENRPAYCEQYIDCLKNNKSEFCNLYDLCNDLKYL